MGRGAGPGAGAGWRPQKRESLLVGSPHPTHPAAFSSAAWARSQARHGAPWPCVLLQYCVMARMHGDTLSGRPECALAAQASVAMRGRRCGEGCGMASVAVAAGWHGQKLDDCVRRRTRDRQIDHRTSYEFVNLPGRSLAHRIRSLPGSPAPLPAQRATGRRLTAQEPASVLEQRHGPISRVYTGQLGTLTASRCTACRAGSRSRHGSSCIAQHWEHMRVLGTAARAALPPSNAGRRGTH